MSGRDLVGVLAARWLVVALVAAVAFGAVTTALIARDDVYAARAGVVVRSEDPRVDLRLAYYSQQLVSGNYNPYADYFAVRARGGGTASSAPTHELRTTTIVGNDEVTVELVGLSDTPRRAAELAGSEAEGFLEWVSAGDAHSKEAPIVRARITELARPPGGPVGPSVGVVALVGAVAAGALGVAAGLASEAGARRSERRRCRPDSV